MAGSRPLHPVEASPLHARRERVFLLLAGIFLGAMSMLNILGVTKFIQLGPFGLAVGVLPYPLTFLCTDLISELYGRARANAVVWTGFLINLMILSFVWAGDRAPPIAFRTELQRIVTLPYLDAFDADGQPVIDPATGYWLAVPALPKNPESGDPKALAPVKQVTLAPFPGAPQTAERLVDAESGRPLLREETLFGRIAHAARQAVWASMIAYLAAQLIDVWLFHFWKRVTRGRHLWLRNNGSTLVSQGVDTICVVTITFWASLAAGEITWSQVGYLIAGGYSFKLTVALLDTLPFYLAVTWLSRYLAIDSVAQDVDA